MIPIRELVWMICGAFAAIAIAAAAFGGTRYDGANQNCFDARGEFLHSGPCLDGKKWINWCDQVRRIAKSEHHCAWPEEGGNEGFFWSHFIRGSSPLEAWKNFKNNLGGIYTIDCYDPKKPRSFYDASNPQPKGFYLWMDKVSHVAFKQNINIDGDEEIFLKYYWARETPLKAVEHYRRDYARWNGGGDP